MDASAISVVKVQKRQPRRVCHPLMATWNKEQCSRGPQNGIKAQNQVVLKAEYQGKVMELNLVKATLENNSYTLVALISKVKLSELLASLHNL